MVSCWTLAVHRPSSDLLTARHGIYVWHLQVAVTAADVGGAVQPAQR